MIKPFHLSMVVADLNKTKEFYVKTLGCEVGREAGTWIDILFFGHQITLHQEYEGSEAKAIDHFGPILEKNEWEAVLSKLAADNIFFELTPFVRGSGTDSEMGKYIVKDPAGNLIEFKYYNNFPLTIGKR
ncbi:VOC family protein [Microbulbifer sp. TYP-18]|uniref:VOC family protein n=1 Tax=Microbulbifer sp. TYP-18 TaxID=3230024 RepID=UPI0034C67FB6